VLSLLHEKTSSLLGSVAVALLQRLEIGCFVTGPPTHSVVGPDW